MSQKFEARFDEFIKELGGERIPPAKTAASSEQTIFSGVPPLSRLTWSLN